MNNVIHNEIGTDGTSIARSRRMKGTRPRLLWYLLAVLAILSTAVLVAMN